MVARSLVSTNTDLEANYRVAQAADVVLERQSRSFLLFALPRVRVRADVIEFVSPGPAPQPGGVRVPPASGSDLRE